MMSKAVLEVENRKEIYNIIEEYPGLHMRDIQRRSGLSMNLVRYHLTQLKKYRLVSEVKEDKYKRYYPKKGKRRVDKKDKQYLASLRKETPLSIVLYLLKKGKPTSHTQIKNRLDIPASSLSYHLKKMEEKGILEKVERKYSLSDPERVSRLLIEYEPPQDVIDEFIDLWEDLSLF